MNISTASQKKKNSKLSLPSALSSFLGIIILFLRLQPPLLNYYFKWVLIENTFTLHFRFIVSCICLMFYQISLVFFSLRGGANRSLQLPPSPGSATGTSVFQRPSQRRVRGVLVHVIARTTYDRPRMPLVSFAPCISSRADPVDALRKITKSKTEFQMNSSTSE